MALIGYARVSTEDQNLTGQLDRLRAAGCGEIFEERASGALRSRPELASALKRVRKGDTLVVARIDRLARSLSHLLEVVELLRDRGAYFRSLADPIDTSGPSGMLVLQMLGAVAEFERSLIRERTKAGLRAAAARGRVGGNPGLRRRDPGVLRKLAASRRRTKLADILPGLDEWLPVVKRMRPASSWDSVLVAVNDALPAGRPEFDLARLMRSVRLLVDEGMAPREVLLRAPNRSARKVSALTKRATVIVSTFLSAKSDATLEEIGAELLRQQIKPPRGGGRWAPSSVKALVERSLVSAPLVDAHGLS